MTRLGTILAALVLAYNGQGTVASNLGGSFIYVAGAADAALLDAGVTQEQVNDLSIDIEVKGIGMPGTVRYTRQQAFLIPVADLQSAKDRLAAILCAAGDAACLVTESSGFGLRYSTTGLEPATHVAAIMQTTDAIERAVLARFTSSERFEGAELPAKLAALSLIGIEAAP